MSPEMWEIKRNLPYHVHREECSVLPQPPNCELCIGGEHGRNEGFLFLPERGKPTGRGCPHRDVTTAATVKTTDLEYSFIKPNAWRNSRQQG